jgi:hypothetical protein
MSQPARRSPDANRHLPHRGCTSTFGISAPASRGEYRYVSRSYGERPSAMNRAASVKTS